MKYTVQQVAWLRPGSIFLSTPEGMMVKVVQHPRGDTQTFILMMTKALDELAKTPKGLGLYMAPEDCILITEHQPDVFQTQKKDAPTGEQYVGPGAVEIILTLAERLSPEQREQLKTRL